MIKRNSLSPWEGSDNFNEEYHKLLRLFKFHSQGFDSDRRDSLIRAGQIKLQDHDMPFPTGVRAALPPAMNWREENDSVLCALHVLLVFFPSRWFGRHCVENGVHLPEHVVIPSVIRDK